MAAAGDYTMFASVASGSTSGSFKLSIDGDDITEEIAVPQNEGTDNYDDFSLVKANVKLTAGKHILRFTVTGDWMDIDYFEFAAGKDAEPGKTSISAVKFQNKVADSYRVFDLRGTVLGTIDLSRTGNASAALKAAGFKKGVYMLKHVQGNKTFVVNFAK